VKRDRETAIYSAFHVIEVSTSFANKGLKLLKQWKETGKLLFIALFTLLRYRPVLPTKDLSSLPMPHSDENCYSVHYQNIYGLN